MDIRVAAIVYYVAKERLIDAHQDDNTLHEMVVAWLWRRGHKAPATAYSISQDVRARLQALIEEELGDPDSYGGAGAAGLNRGMASIVYSFLLHRDGHWTAAHFFGGINFPKEYADNYVHGHIIKWLWVNGHHAPAMGYAIARNLREVIYDLVQAEADADYVFGIYGVEELGFNKTFCEV